MPGFDMPGCKRAGRVLAGRNRELCMTTDAGTAGTAAAERQWGDPAFAGLARACGLVVLLLIGGIIAVMLLGGRQAFSTFGWGFLSSSAWNPVLDRYGALTAVFGTVVTAAIGLVVAVPLAFGVAFCLTEMAPAWLSGPARHRGRAAGGGALHHLRHVGLLRDRAGHGARHPAAADPHPGPRAPAASVLFRRRPSAPGCSPPA